MTCCKFSVCLILLTIQFGKPLPTAENEQPIGSLSDPKIADESKRIGSIINVGGITNVLPVNTSSLLPVFDLTKKCCGKYGCFTMDPPFGFTLCRPVMPLPFCQDILQVRFYVWTKETPTGRQEVDPEKAEPLATLSIQKMVCAVVYINGYLGTGDMFFIRDTKDLILQISDCIFVSVEWAIPAHFDYLLSVANAEVVAAVTAYFIQLLMTHYEVGPEVFHIIGYSLGAHIAGGVGKRIPSIGRITGLDPAKPLFEGCPSTVRLSRTDATFVDVMHLDMRAFATTTPSGHADIFVNGGYAQDPCLGIAICGHYLAPFYFIESMKANCPFLAYQCDDQDNFMRGKCARGCGDDRSLCIPLGYHAYKWRNHSRESPTLFFMDIQANKPFCVYHYYLEINCTDDQVRLWRYGKNEDKLYINLIGDDGETGFKQANANSIRYTTVPFITTLITSSNQIGRIIRVQLKWEPEGAVSPDQDCQQEPTVIKKFNYSRGRCLICPYTVQVIYAKNLESDNSATFDGRNAALKPGQVEEFSAE